MLGKIVTVIIDRPMGSAHPQYPALIYPVNYGYIPGTMAADGEPEDAYVLGLDHPVFQFTGRVIAEIHRENDVEDKWVVAPEGAAFTARQIRDAVDFQEHYFNSTVRLL